MNCCDGETFSSGECVCVSVFESFLLYLNLGFKCVCVCVCVCVETFYVFLCSKSLERRDV